MEKNEDKKSSVFKKYIKQNRFTETLHKPITNQNTLFRNIIGSFN